MAATMRTISIPLSKEDKLLQRMQRKAESARVARLLAPGLGDNWSQVRVFPLNLTENGRRSTEN